MSFFIATAAMVVAIFYSAALLVLAIYGLHSVWLLILYIRKHSAMQAQELIEQKIILPDDELPDVLVQIPLFNERDVAEQTIVACAALKYPRNKLHIQVLDDSTDDTHIVVAQVISQLQQNGIDAVHITRSHRIGFKAGALAHGLTLHHAPFVAIFDADFQPQPDFLRRAIIPFLHDENLALVQGRWDHANRSANALTSAQALGIDSHFAIEQGARAWNNLTLNFNGTCGMWRRAAIDDAGGWQHDTLTEDMDLSYRVQLRGWKCTYRSTIVVPGELPTTLGAWRTQQFRWAKGSLQTLVKLAHPVLHSAWPWQRRLAALLHLSHYLIHPLIFLSVLCAPLAMLAIPFLPIGMITTMITCFVLGAAAPFILYASSQVILRGPRGLGNLRHLPMLTAMGTGIAISNSVAAWQVLRGIQSPFIRTPKQGISLGSYRAQTANGWPELLIAAWSATGLLAGFTWSHAWMAPLLWLYTGGFAWIGWKTLRESGLRFTDLSLPVIGLLSLLCYSFLANLAFSWREMPTTFALVGLIIGTLYIAAVALVWYRHAHDKPLPSLLFIFAIALTMRLLCLGLTPSDDIARYAIEGQQILAGENPYSIAPATSAVAATMPTAITAPLNHGNWTAIYPPLALAYHAVIGAIATEPFYYQLAALILEIIALWLIVRLMRDHHLPPAFIICAAWNPVGPLFITGEGHHDILMVVLVLLAIVWASCSLSRSLIAMSCAALVKPFAVVALIPLLIQRRWWWWMLPVVLAVIAYLPFTSAGLGMVMSLGRFGSEMHFHGPLEPLIRELWSWFVPQAAVRAGTIITLLGLMVVGHAIILRARSQLSLPVLLARLFAMLLLCLPTMHPWYFIVVVAMLPFTRSYGLLLWTALAPVYWLHGIAIQSTGMWIESAWVTSLAHLPALVLLMWEAAGRPALSQRPKTETTWEMSS